MGCRNYRARLEEYIIRAGLRPATDRQLDEHLRGCTKCRLALDDALLASELMRHAWAPVIELSDNFAARVMASIREEVSRRARPEAIWRPLELLGSKFALGAAAALLLLSVYLAEFAPSYNPPTVASPAEVGSIMPEAPAPPSNPEEVLISLMERENDL